MRRCIRAYVAMLLAGLSVLFVHPGALARDKLDLEACYGDTLEVAMKGEVRGEPVTTFLSLPLKPYPRMHLRAEPDQLDPYEACLEEPVQTTGVSMINSKQTSGALFGFDEEGNRLWVQLTSLRYGRYLDVDANYAGFVDQLSLRLHRGESRPFVLPDGFIRIGRPDNPFGLFIAPPGWTRPSGDPMTLDCSPTLGAEASCSIAYMLPSGLAVRLRILIDGAPFRDLPELDRQIRKFVQNLITSTQEAE